MSKIIFMILATVCALPLAAQKKQREEVRKVTYTMAFTDDVSPERAKAIVLEQAQIEAVAQAFGTTLSMSNELVEGTKDGHVFNDITVKTTSDVRGEWVETIGTPEWFNARHGDRLTEYTVTVKGRIREWNPETADLDIRLLRNGVDTLQNKVRDFTYYAKDDFYVYFRSPQSGYLAIYATKEVGDHKIAQRLLPYPRQQEDAYPVQADEEYYFFSPEKSRLDSRVIALKLDCHGEEDINKVYVIYSPSPFIRAADATDNITNLNQLSLPDFHRWLTNRRHKDPHTQVKPFVITIKKN